MKQVVLLLLTLACLSVGTACTMTPPEDVPPAPFDFAMDADSLPFARRFPQSIKQSPFDSPSLLVPNPRLRNSETQFSKHYWQARAGQEMWRKATFGNATDLQSLDWFQILRTDLRGRARWEKWGLLSDPDCCTPGKECEEKYPHQKIPAMSGYDYCPGDEHMWSSPKVDPACDFLDQDGRTRDQRQETMGTLSRTACQLQFGWSAGVIGIRKFPNPKFVPGIGSGSGSGTPARPFLFGVSCAACHAGLNPLHGTRSIDHIEWSQISLNVGNPYLRFPKMLATGLNPASWTFHHLANVPAGRAPMTLDPESLKIFKKVGLIANLEARPEFSGEGFNGPRFFIDGKEWVGLDRFLSRKVRGMVSDSTRSNLPEFEIRLPALRAFVHSFRVFQLPKDLLPDQTAQEKGSLVFARNCASCHSSQRPIEARDRIDREVRSLDSTLPQDAEFYRGANFKAHRADDPSLRLDYLSNELDVVVDGQFDACSEEGRVQDATRVMKNKSLLNPWLHLPLLSRGSVGPRPRAICLSQKDEACLKNKSFEFRHAMKILLSTNQQRRATPLYVTAPWRVQLPQSNVRWLIPSGTSWPLIDHVRIDDLDQDLGDSRRTGRVVMARADRFAVGNIVGVLETFLKAGSILKSPGNQGPLPSAPLLDLISPSTILSLQLPRAQTEALLRAYSLCPQASQLNRYTESSGHEFGTSLSDADKKALIEFLLSL